MDNNYGGVVWTNHALQRLRERRIAQGDAWAAFNRPDQSRYAKSRGAWIYYKTWKSQRIEVVAKKNEQGKWIILSVWSKPNFISHKPKQRSLLSGLFKFIFNK